MTIIECPENKGIKTPLDHPPSNLLGIIECPENKGIKTYYMVVIFKDNGLSNALKTKGLRRA